MLLLPGCDPLGGTPAVTYLVQRAHIEPRHQRSREEPRHVRDHCEAAASAQRVS